jgi:predicted GIY-YIG superfamily endonuclease
MSSLTEPAASVYRYYDENNVLLYVGYTTQGPKRNHQHASDKTWWPFVARQEVDHYETVDEAKKQEVQLIRHYRPPFNKQHNPDSDSMAESYLRMAVMPFGGSRLTLMEILRGNAKQLPTNVVLQNRTQLVVSAAPKYLELSKLVAEEGVGGRVYFNGQKIGHITQVRNQDGALIVSAQLRHAVPKIGESFLKLTLHRDGKNVAPSIRSLQVSYELSDDMLIESVATVLRKFMPIIESQPEVLDNLIPKSLARLQHLKRVQELAESESDGDAE